jgi:Glycosyltransferase family 87
VLAAITRSREAAVISWIVLALAVVGTVGAKSHAIASGVRAIGTQHVASGNTNLAADFALSIWIPTQALRHKLDPYDPSRRGSEQRYGAHVPAGFYSPGLLLLLWPITALALPEAAEAMTILSCLLIWLSLWLVVVPRTALRRLLLAALGVVTIFGYSAENGLMLGQPSAIFLLGVALVTRAVISGRWGAGAAAGATLLMLKPQYALPTLAVLFVLRRWRTALYALAISLVVATPFAVLEVRAAGGIGAAASSLRRNLTFFQNYNSGWGRTDLLVLLTNGQPAKAGLAGTAVCLLALAALLWLAVSKARGPRDIVLVATISGFVLASAYHTSYDLLILALPAALLLRPESRRNGPLTAVLAVYVALDFLSRASFRYRIGGEFVTVMHNWWPPVIALAAFVLGAWLLMAPSTDGLPKLEPVDQPA